MSQGRMGRSWNARAPAAGAGRDGREGRMVIVAALVLLIPVSASSDLIKQMEFEIKIKEIIEEVYEASLKAALVAVKKRASMPDTGRPGTTLTGLMTSTGKR